MLAALAIRLRIYLGYMISFDASAVSPRHKIWLEQVKLRAGLAELSPQPYWGFKDLCHKAGTKLHNCFYVGAAVRRTNNKESFRYSKILMLKEFSEERFIASIEAGDILIDFDARSGHNHGTKFRFKNSRLPELYKDVTVIASDEG